MSFVVQSLLAFGLLNLAGCGTHVPEFTSQQVLPLSVLVERIDCEFEDAVRTQIYRQNPPRIWLKGWQGTYTITLKGNETGTLAANGNTFPFILPRGSALNLSVGGGVTTTANRTGILTFNLDFASIKDGPRCETKSEFTGHPLLKGRIGIEDWMERALEGALNDKKLRSNPSAITGIGHTFEFNIDMAASAAPSFVIAPAPTIALNPAGSVERFEGNVVQIALGQAAKGSEAVTKTVAVYSKDQQMLIAEDKAKIASLNAQIAVQETKLQKKENQELLIMQARSNLVFESFKFPQSDNNDFMTVQRDASSFLARNATALADLNKTVADNKRDREDAVKTRTQLQETLNRPASTTVTQKQVAVASPLPADQNPNIVNTSTQLTFERLNNSLRVPIR